MTSMGPTGSFTLSLHDSQEDMVELVLTPQTNKTSANHRLNFPRSQKAIVDFLLASLLLARNGVEVHFFPRACFFS